MIIEDHQKQTSPAVPKAGRNNRNAVQNEGNKMLQRVKKQDIKTNTWARPDPLEYCLAVWKDWMASTGQRNLGARIMGGLAGEADGHGQDLHEAQHSHDMQIAAATDAMIDSLDRIHVWAIYASCSIATAWRFRNADLITTAADAREALVGKLKKNECTRNLF